LNNLGGEGKAEISIISLEIASFCCYLIVVVTSSFRKGDGGSDGDGQNFYHQPMKKF